MPLRDDDRLALKVHAQARALAEIGLAPLLFDAMRLEMSPTRARALVDRLTLIVAMRAKAESDRRERDALLEAARRDAHKRAG